MKKIVISITEPQQGWLNAEAQRLQISVAELIRRIIDKERQA